MLEVIPWIPRHHRPNHARQSDARGVRSDAPREDPVASDLRVRVTVDLVGVQHHFTRPCVQGQPSQLGLPPLPVRYDATRARGVVTDLPGRTMRALAGVNFEQHPAADSQVRVAGLTIGPRLDHMERPARDRKVVLLAREDDGGGDAATLDRGLAPCGARAAYERSRS